MTLNKFQTQRLKFIMSKFTGSFEEEGSSITSKNQTRTEFSTFIEDIQSTTEKLMNEVFSTPIFRKDGHSQPDSSNRHQRTHSTVPSNEVIKIIPRNNFMSTSTSSQAHQQFFKRVEYFERTKQHNLDIIRRNIEESLEKECTHFPITNPTFVEVAPIQDRYEEVIRKKQRKLEAQRIQNRVTEEKQLASYPFKPKINEPPGLQRTFEEYYQEKQKWDRKKQQSRQKKKQIEQIKLNRQCTFKPELETRKSKFYKQNARKIKNTKVEDRLMRSLEESCDRKRISQGL